LVGGRKLERRSVSDDSGLAEVGWACVLSEAQWVAERSYFRMLLAGYFEGIQSQRGIAWRCADSFSLRSFLRVALTEQTPDHLSLTKIRERLPQEVHASAVYRDSRNEQRVTLSGSAKTLSLKQTRR